MSLLDEIEQRGPKVGPNEMGLIWGQDLDIYKRLARLAEQAQGYLKGDSNIFQEIHTILHPAPKPPAKGSVYWADGHEKFPAPVEKLAEGVTLEEAKRRMGARPTVKEDIESLAREAKAGLALLDARAEIAMLNQRLQAEEMVSCSLSKDRDRLRGALELIAAYDAWIVGTPVFIARDALRGGS